MNDDRYTKAWRTTAVKQGVALGALTGDAFAATLAAASLALPAGARMTEREVNDALRAWLAGAGAMLATDHVELRRWLVDCRLVTRDGFGRCYARASAPEPFAAAVEGLAGADLAAIARNARDADNQARSERKARWKASQDSTKTSMR